MLGAQFQMNWSNKLPHINHNDLARYFIPDFVEEDKVLYLDSDLVVTADLTPLFEMDLGETTWLPHHLVLELGLALMQVYS